MITKNNFTNYLTLIKSSLKGSLEEVSSEANLILWILTKTLETAMLGDMIATSDILKEELTLSRIWPMAIGTSSWIVTDIFRVVQGFSSNESFYQCLLIIYLITMNIMFMFGYLCFNIIVSGFTKRCQAIQLTIQNEPLIHKRLDYFENILEQYRTVQHSVEFYLLVYVVVIGILYVFDVYFFVMATTRHDFLDILTNAGYPITDFFILYTISVLCHDSYEEIKKCKHYLR